MWFQLEGQFGFDSESASAAETNARDGMDVVGRNPAAAAGAAAVDVDGARMEVDEGAGKYLTSRNVLHI